MRADTTYDALLQLPGQVLATTSRSLLAIFCSLLDTSSLGQLNTVQKMDSIATPMPMLSSVGGLYSARPINPGDLTAWNKLPSICSTEL